MLCIIRLLYNKYLLIQFKAFNTCIVMSKIFILAFNFHHNLFSAYFSNVMSHYFSFMNLLFQETSLYTIPLKYCILSHSFFLAVILCLQMPTSYRNYQILQSLLKSPHHIKHGQYKAWPDQFGVSLLPNLKFHCWICA